LTPGGEVVGSLGMVVWGEGDRDQSVGAKKNVFKRIEDMPGAHLMTSKSEGLSTDGPRSLSVR